MTKTCSLITLVFLALLGSSVVPQLAYSTDDLPQLKIAIAQPMTVVGDVQENLKRMRPLVASAAKAGAQLVVFSECSLTGYDLKGVAAKSALHADDPALASVAQMASDMQLAMVVGFHEKDGGKLYNSAMAVLPSGGHVIQRKHAVANAESTLCSVVPGPRERKLFEVAGFRCAILICADDGIENIYQELAAANCDATILITAGAGSVASGWSEAELKIPERRQQYLASALTCISPQAVERAAELNLAQIACNQAGWNAEIGYFQPGGASIIDARANVVAIIPPRFVLEHVRSELALGTISRFKAGGR